MSLALELLAPYSNFIYQRMIFYKISLAIQAQASASARAWWWFAK